MEFDSTAARRNLRTRNDARHRLGLALPSGQVSAFVARGAAALLLNEASVRDVAVGEELELDLGESTDVQVSSAQVGGVNHVEIHNARSSSVSFELNLSLPGDTQLVAAHPRVMRVHGHPRFRLTIPAGGSATIGYRTRAPG
jgi:hypothetical protein